MHRPLPMETAVKQTAEQTDGNSQQSPQETIQGTNLSAEIEVLTRVVPYLQFHAVIEQKAG